MTDTEKMRLREHMIILLDGSISDDYIGRIIDNILDDVAEDIDTTADKNYNNDDVRLAIGRILIEKLGIDY